MYQKEQVVSILFSDLEGYSKIKNDSLKLKLVKFLENDIIKKVLTKDNHLFYNSWGDAFFICSSNPLDLAEIALQIRDKIKNKDWKRFDFQFDIAIRIGLHIQNVKVSFKNNGQINNIIGKGIDTTARIEPITEPNQVYCSDVFYNHINLEETHKIEGNFIGEKELAKHFGLMKIYKLDWKVTEQTKDTPQKLVTIISRQSEKSIIYLEDLEGRCIYVSTADIHIHNFYKEHSGKTDFFINHLITGILLGDRIIVHCADPARLQIVYENIMEYCDLIKEGKIVFLLGENVKNSKESYRSYLIEKYNEYKKSPYGQNDIKTLEGIINNDEIINRTYDLLNMSPYNLYRKYSGTDKFVNLVTKDLEPSENIFTKRKNIDGKISKLNLTLFQLLSIKIINELNNIEDVIPPIELRKLESNLKDKLNSVSRQILIGKIEEALGNVNISTYYLNLIKTRIYLLYLAVNVDNHTFIEVNIDRDRKSPYYCEHLKQHLRALCVGKTFSLNKDIVLKLKRNERWKSFVNYHYSITSHYYAKRLGDTDRGIENCFSMKEALKSFPDIIQIIFD